MTYLSEPAAHKKTVSESETVAGQQPEITAAKSAKPTAAKTFRSSRGALLRSVPRFINKFLG
jgi:hypothetical protein